MKLEAYHLLTRSQHLELMMLTNKKRANLVGICVGMLSHDRLGIVFNRGLDMSFHDHLEIKYNKNTLFKNEARNATAYSMWAETETDRQPER